MKQFHSTKVCDNKMNYNECELAILFNASRSSTRKNIEKSSEFTRNKRNV